MLKPIVVNLKYDLIYLNIFQEIMGKIGIAKCKYNFS